MPYGLNKLWDCNKSITYASEEGTKLRNSTSLEENASFLVRWGEELFADWATVMTLKLPGCNTSRKTSTLRIVYKIQEMFNKGEISSLNEGWTKLTDILRANVVCENKDKVMKVLETFIAFQRATILRVKPRFGPPKNLNDVTINFDYQG